MADQQASQWLLTLIDNRDSHHPFVTIGVTSASSRPFPDFILKSLISGMHAFWTRSYYFPLFQRDVVIRQLSQNEAMHGTWHLIPLFMTVLERPVCRAHIADVLSLFPVHQSSCR